MKRRKRLGILGRADWHGGVANQSLAIARHLDVDRALVIDMSEGNRGRSPFDIKPWHATLGRERVAVAPFPVGDAALDWLLADVDTVFAVEGPPPGRDDFPERCSAAHVEFVIHANPELWRDRYRGPSTRVVLPTSWHAERFPDARVLPMPVDTTRFPYRCRTEARKFLHVAAPAFHDRCGSDLVRASLAFVKTPIELYVRGISDVHHEEGVGNVKLVFLPPVDDHADLYPADADVLLHLRRYGGNSLTANEAAALGMPIVTLDLPPLNERAGMWLVRPHLGPRHEWMIGGNEAVYDADPRDVATAIDVLANEPAMVRQLSDGAHAWACEHSWDALGPAWRKELGR